MNDIFDTRFEGKTVEIKDNRINLGDEVNINAKVPTINKIHIGVGWDANTFEGEAPDADVSAFLLGRGDQTRNDDDFVFYNQPEALGGAIRHLGDSRTGAGDGDDEGLSISLNGVPFDIFQIVFVLSLYKGEEKRQNLSQIRNVYIRLVEEGTGQELLRFELDAHMRDRTETAMIVAHLNREGPKWHFVPKAEFAPGGLAALATRFGLVVAEQ